MYRRAWGSGPGMVLSKFQCQGILLIWIIVWQGPTLLAVSVGGGGGVWTFLLSSIISLFFLSVSGRLLDID